LGAINKSLDAEVSDDYEMELDDYDEEIIDEQKPDRS